MNLAAFNLPFHAVTGERRFGLPPPSPRDGMAMAICAAAAQTIIQAALFTRDQRMTGVILSGGKNTRMGSNKAFLKVDGERLIDRAVRIFREVCDEIILVTNEPQLYLDQDVAIVTDLEKGKGPLMGIYTGLFWAASETAFVAACDMPFLSAPFIRYLRDQSGGDVDIVVPETADGLQPLHAVYSRRCLPAIKARLDRDRLKVTEFYRGMKVRTVSAETIRRFDPHGRMFLNVNTVEEFANLRQSEQPS